KSFTKNVGKNNMAVLFRIALRNLREHKSKSLIIGVLITLGILILTLGNSILDTARQGVERSYVDSFTGNILVRTQSEDAVTINGSFDPDVASQSIGGYVDLYEYITSLPQAAVANPQITAFANIDFSEKDRDRGVSLAVYGIEPESYREMFPENVNVLEGRFLEPGESGIVVNKETIDSIRNDLGIDLQIGDEIKLQGGGNAGLRIRRLVLRGVYEYSNASGNINAFIDASNMRSLVGMVVGTVDVVNIDEADTSLLDSTVFSDVFSDDGSEADALFSEDSFFSDDSFFADDTIDAAGGDAGDGAAGDGAAGDTDVFNILGDLSERNQASVPDAGAWSYLLIRLNADSQTNATITQLNTYFDEQGWPLEAVDWVVASGGAAQFSNATRIFFYILVIILAVVAVIIIMNTLVISIIERRKEIGTMRSLGAYKKLIRYMFIAESVSISLIFGSVGLILGFLIVALLNAVGIPAPNLFIQSLFGGEVLRPVFSITTVFIGYAVMLGIGFISSLYPVRVALKIQPLEAMQSV
ncbi:MAG: ABC transporter permease, partial [Salinispira sp.]